jgi:hypothetical protein
LALKFAFKMEVEFGCNTAIKTFIFDNFWIKWLIKYSWTADPHENYVCVKGCLIETYQCYI